MSAVYIAHCIDTEGPLYESLDAKFGRLRDLFQITHITPTKENFHKLQNGEIDLGGVEEKVQEVFSSHLTNYMDSWDKVEDMLARCTDAGFRRRMLDSDGNGWIYNWFLLDHVGYFDNPRRRDMGFHNIYDRYVDFLNQSGWLDVDGIGWHFHPMSTYREAHRCATHYFRSPEIFEILSRKIIERGFFPATYRAGFQAERPDSHWFLEQWIPFDITNMAQEDNSDLDVSVDFRNGRSGDWRRAPHNWSVYHPDHDDYQQPGNCRRAIARCLNVLNRIAPITQYEMDKAFARAASGEPALVGFCSHDFRDLAHEVEHLRDLIRSSAEKYPKVPFYFCEAGEAFRRVLHSNSEREDAVELELSFHAESDADVAHIEIEAIKGSVFGPQPWLAMETKSRRFLHDNLDFMGDGKRWSYAFHADTLPIEDVRRIGVAANDRFGNTSVKVLDMTSALDTA